MSQLVEDFGMPVGMPVQAVLPAWIIDPPNVDHPDLFDVDLPLVSKDVFHVLNARNLPPFVGGTQSNCSLRETHV